MSLEVTQHKKGEGPVTEIERKYARKWVVYICRKPRRSDIPNIYKAH